MQNMKQNSFQITLLKMEGNLFPKVNNLWQAQCISKKFDNSVSQNDTQRDKCQYCIFIQWPNWKKLNAIPLGVGGDNIFRV